MPGWFRTLSLVALATIMLLAGGQAQAQDYPNRNITIIVPFAAGGTTDIIGRLIGQKLSEFTGVTVLVENVPGAATIIGTEKAARSAPDGYTLYLASSTPFATNPNFYRKLRYSIDDFEMISLISRVPLMFDVNPNLPVDSVQSMVSYAKQKPGGVTVGSPGHGSLGEIVNGMARGILDMPLTDVPYRGGGLALGDVLKGVTDAYFDAISSTLPLYQTGKIKVLASTGRSRSPAAPNVPTLVELGYKDFVLENLYSIMAPKGTPRPIIDKLNGLLRRALSDTDFREKMLTQGVVLEASSPEELRKAVQADYEFMARMARQFNIKPLE